MTRTIMMRCERCGTQVERKMTLDNPSRDWTNCAVGLRSDIDFCPDCWSAIMALAMPKSEPPR